LQHIERRYAKANDEFRDEYLSGDAEDRLAKSVKRTIERAESLYGRLDELQRVRVTNAVAGSPFDPELWLSERRRRQQDALDTLRGLAGDAAARERAPAALRAWYTRIERSPRATYRRYSEQLTQFNCGFTASLHNGTSAAQRQAAADKLKGWEADLRALGATANGGGGR
jgi:hypothetical protein